MKISTLIFCSLFALIAHAQTKDAEFKKVERLLKQSNGLTTPDFKILDIVFSETSVKMKINSEGKSSSISYSDLNWDEFEFFIEKMEDNEDLSVLSISFNEEFDFVYYENNKVIEEDTDVEILLYFKRSDANTLQKLLEELQLYTWESYNVLRTADKNELVQFITKNLNKAVEDLDCKIKSITSCEISIVSEEGDEIILPTKRLKIHEKEFLSDEYVICYGKENAVIKSKIGSTYTAQTLEHPELELNFEDSSEVVPLLEYAIKRLYGYCNY